MPRKTLNKIVRRYSDIIVSLVVATFFSIILVLMLNGQKEETIANREKINDVRETQTKNRSLTEDEHEEILDKLDTCLKANALHK